MINITHDMMYKAAEVVANQIKIDFADKIKNGDKVKCYPIPKGAIPCAYLVKHFIPDNFWIVDSLEDQFDILLDDLIDLGGTKLKYTNMFPNAKFYALFEKGANIEREWLVFPHDKTEGKNEDASGHDIAIRLFQYLNIDMNDPFNKEHLSKTPQRFLNAWKEYTRGYSQNPEEILKTSFVEGSQTYDQMIILEGIESASQCAHHLAMFTTKTSIAYIPDQRLLGLSKLARITECFANRLQVQEAMTEQIANAIMTHVQPKGVAVVVEGYHSCCSHRGIKKKGKMITSSMKGVFMDNLTTRNEFLSLISKK